MGDKMKDYKPKTKEDFKDSIVFQRDLAEMLGQEVKALQSRVLALEAREKELEADVVEHFEATCRYRDENARLLEQCNTYRSDFGKMVKVVDAAMELIDQPGMSCYVDSQHRQRDFFERLDNLAKAVACVAVTNIKGV